MQKKLLRIVSVIVFLVTAICMNVLAQDESPVRIVFDTDSQRIDLMTGKQIHNYGKQIYHHFSKQRKIR